MSIMTELALLSITDIIYRQQRPIIRIVFASTIKARVPEIWIVFIARESRINTVIVHNLVNSPRGDRKSRG